MATPKKKPEDKLKVGAPTTYKPEYCQKAREMLKKGFAIVEIAAAFDTTRKTLYEWAQRHPEFSDTIYEAVDLSEAWWTAKSRTNLENKDFNSRLYELNMMNRFGWTRKNNDKVESTIKFEDTLKALDE